MPLIPPSSLVSSQMKMQLVPASLISARYFRISVRYFRIPLVTFAFPPVTFGFPHVTFGFRMLLSHFHPLLSGFHPLLSELPKVDCHLLSDPKVDANLLSEVPKIPIRTSVPICRGGSFWEAWTYRGVILGGMDIEGGHFR